MKINFLFIQISKKINKMRTKLFISSALLLTLAGNLSVKASSDVITETRTSSPFHSIQVKGEFEIKLMQDQEPFLTVEGTEYQVGNTVTILRNDTLFITQPNRHKGDRKPVLTIH